MKSLTHAILEMQKVYQAKCPVFKELGYCDPCKCRCQISGEVWAYIREIIPSGYRTKTLTDFGGYIKDGETSKQVLSQKIIVSAKESIKRFCWKDNKDGEDYEENWLERSVMDQRLKEGANLVIYGSPWIKDVNARGEAIALRKQSGKTMLAALVMKEAIRMRMLPGHASETYQWVSFPNLILRLMEDIRDKYRFSEFIEDYQTCDWLVVDDIFVKEQSEKSRTLRSERLDSVFSERIEAKLSTILVFQEDISKMDDISEDFGHAINAIVKSNKTLRISLV